MNSWRKGCSYYEGTSSSHTYLSIRQSSQSLTMATQICRSQHKLGAQNQTLFINIVVHRVAPSTKLSNWARQGDECTIRLCYSKHSLKKKIICTKCLCGTGASAAHLLLSLTLNSECRFFKMSKHMVSTTLLVTQSVIIIIVPCLKAPCSITHNYKNVPSFTSSHLDTPSKVFPLCLHLSLFPLILPALTRFFIPAP